ncbi:helix-turn-helix domain-containing protein [[Clostridium] innocuum]|nr:helix-turn-helix domain-containing protein [[Clostridium] innocuum]MCR0224192.1 helix-turn-helix domain-containing protein [[Clostridium] innocuum]MCR0243324.1 helix-turn-helix domain-containing protein [[Clostridium] innocuum]MCR0257084.1 helix-turn-helix domain-containing protein [[Clostridium] innocuum]
MSTVGENIKKRRKELNLSVDEVAKRLNKNRATIYRYENNDIENMPITVLNRLSKILEISPMVIMGWEEVSVQEKYNQLTDEQKKNIDLLLDDYIKQRR